MLNQMSKELSGNAKKKLNKIFHLKERINGTASVGLTLSEIKKEYEDWSLIADYYSKNEKRTFGIFRHK